MSLHSCKFTIIDILHFVNSLFLQKHLQCKYLFIYNIEIANLFPPKTSRLTEYILHIHLITSSSTGK